MIWPFEAANGVPAPDVKYLPASTMPVRTGIVHLGLGAFHRAHQAVYLERYRQRTGDTHWGVCSANLRANAGLVDRLRESGGRYHVAECSDRSHITVREIGVITEALFTGRDAARRWGRDLESLLARLSSSEVRVVTLTVTEKGYYLTPTDGQLLRDDPAIIADTSNPQAPRTAPGILVEALKRRRAAGVAPIAILSCDNMPDNGRRTCAAVSQLAACYDAELAAWIEREVAFPASMVDRIVPAMSETDFARLAELGVEDPNAVISEGFAQWVVEDRFPSGRPDWAEDGVQMVDDVKPFEAMKLRMLNGGHSLLAYLGRLDGIETVFDAVSRADLAGVLRRYLLEEAAPTLEMPVRTNLKGYAEQLLARFANDSMCHELRQIAMDGSQKLPQRWLQGAIVRLAHGGDIRCTTLAVAAWIRYTSGSNLHGTPHMVGDPLAEQLAALHAKHGPNPPPLVNAFLALSGVFPPALTTYPNFAEGVVAAYRALTEYGLAKTLANLDRLPG